MIFHKSLANFLFITYMKLSWWNHCNYHRHDLMIRDENHPANLTYIETSLNLTILSCSIILLVIFVGLKSDSIEKSEIYRKSSISIVLNGPKMIDSCLCVIFDLKHIKCFMVRFEFGNYFAYKHSVRVRHCSNYCKRFKFRFCP